MTFCLASCLLQAGGTLLTPEQVICSSRAALVHHSQGVTAQGVHQIGSDGETHIDGKHGITYEMKTVGAHGFLKVGPPKSPPAKKARAPYCAPSRMLRKPQLQVPASSSTKWKRISAMSTKPANKSHRVGKKGCKKLNDSYPKLGSQRLSATSFLTISFMFPARMGLVNVAICLRLSVSMTTGSQSTASEHHAHMHPR